VPKKPYIYILYCYSRFFNIRMSLLHHHRHHHIPQLNESSCISSDSRRPMPIIAQYTCAADCMYLYMASAACFFFIAHKLDIVLKSRIYIYVYIEATYHTNCSPSCQLHLSSSLSLLKYTQFICASVRSSYSSQASMCDNRLYCILP
jgi:hypothetical protein